MIRTMHVVREKDLAYLGKVTFDNSLMEVDEPFMPDDLLEITLYPADELSMEDIYGEDI